MKKDITIFKRTISIVCLLLVFGTGTSIAQVLVSSTQTNVTCFGGTDGSISVVASGGYGLFPY